MGWSYICSFTVVTCLTSIIIYVGLENSSHNSEVIHSGIYYPSGSLKSKLCIQGKQLLFDYMKHNDISHRMCGKIIVATAEDEVSTLHSIYENGVRCGLKDLQVLGMLYSVPGSGDIYMHTCIHTHIQICIYMHTFMHYSFYTFFCCFDHHQS
jgi:hypothetical protein